MPQLHHTGDRVGLSPDSLANHQPLMPLVETPPWMADAMCAQTDPDAFFPDKGGSTREAKAICASCTVAAECLDWALDNDERFGIWGGLSERQRRGLAVAKKCRYIDCDQPAWSPGARHCATHRPSPSAIHDSTTQESA